MNSKASKLLAIQIADQITDNIAQLVAAEVEKQLAKYARQATLMSTQEAADYLDISVRKMYQLIDVVPHTKIGRCLKFRRQDLDAYANQ